MNLYDTWKRIKETAQQKYKAGVTSEEEFQFASEQEKQALAVSASETRLVAREIKKLEVGMEVIND